MVESPQKGKVVSEHGKYFVVVDVRRHELAAHLTVGGAKP